MSGNGRATFTSHVRHARCQTNQRWQCCCFIGNTKATGSITIGTRVSLNATSITVAFVREVLAFYYAASVLLCMNRTALHVCIWPYTESIGNRVPHGRSRSPHSMRLFKSAAALMLLVDQLGIGRRSLGLMPCLQESDSSRWSSRPDLKIVQRRRALETGILS